MKERIEDLGRLFVLLDHVIHHGIFKFYMGRNKDFSEFIEEMNQEKRMDFMHDLIYGIKEVEEILYECRAIAQGDEDV